MYVRLIFVHTRKKKRRWSFGRRDCVCVCATCKYRMTSIMSICWRWQSTRLATPLNYCSNASIIQPTKASATAAMQQAKYEKCNNIEEKWQKVRRDRDEIPIVWQNKFNPIKWRYKIQIMPTMNLCKMFFFVLFVPSSSLLSFIAYSSPSYVVFFFFFF